MKPKLLIACAAVVAVCAVPAAPAHGTRYVALGDSYSSGTGARGYYDRACKRSGRSYPYLLHALHPDWELVHAACSGAKTRDVWSSQAASLDGATEWVTYTAGGNDARFSKVIKECALPGWASDCAGRIDRAQAFIAATLPRRLDRMNAVIAARAPAASVIVLGYPQLFTGEDCDPATFFSPAEQARLRSTGELLRDALRDAALRAGGRFSFHDVMPAFLGHALCDVDPWLRGLSVPLGESFHPNAAGQRLGYLPVVRAALG